MNNFPIGVLDSGLGGLSIAKEIKKLMSNHSIVYFGDSANVPYSTKSEVEVYRLSKKAIEFLLAKRAKIIVIACNTITVVALDRLRKNFPKTTIVGTVPVIKTAVSITKSGKIGIFSTKKTAESIYQKQLIKKFAKGYSVLNLGSNEIVPFIESSNIKLKNVLKKQLKPFKEHGVGVLALGCTHFPLIKNHIEKIMGSKVSVIDSGAAVARQVRRILEGSNTLSKSSAEDIFYTSGDISQMEKFVKQLKLSGDVKKISD